MNELKELVEQPTYRTPKEQAQADVRFQWLKLRSLMNQLLPLVEQAKWLPGDLLDEQTKTANELRTSLHKLREPYVREYQRKVESGEITSEIIAQEKEEAEKRAAAMTAHRERKSDIQECVDEWLKERIEEYDLNPALLEETDTESFEYTRTETWEEYRSGSMNFTVPDRVKERLDEAMEEDFNDELKEYLDGCLYDKFEMDVDNYDSGNMTDSSSELT